MDGLAGYNETSWDEEENVYYTMKADKILLLCIYIPVFVIALVGNILVLVMVCMNKSVRRNVANYFLVNLAVADLLVTIICIPLTVSQMIYTVWIYGDFMCRTLDFLQGISVEGSVLTIVCMSFERYFAIRHPMKVRRICSEQNVIIAIVGTWVLAVIIMCPLVIYRRLITPTIDVLDSLNQTHGAAFNLDMFNVTQETTSYCSENWPSHSDRIAYDMFQLFMVYIIPGFIVVILYSLIGCSLCKQNFDLNRANSVVSNDVKIMAGRRKLARMMIIISILFALCWLPYFIITICFDFNLTIYLNKLYPFALLLAHSHSAQNPILYCCMHRGFYEFLVKLVRCQPSGNRRQSNSFTASDRRTQSLRISKMNEGKPDERKRLVVTLSDPGKAV